MPKKHGTVRPAVRPSGSVNRDRFGQFGLFQSLNDVVHFSFSFLFSFFFSLNGVVLKWLQRFLFCPSYTASFCPLSKSLKPFLISKHNSLVSALSQISETASLISQKSLSNPLTLKYSRRRTSQLPRRRRSSAQV